MVEQLCSTIKTLVFEGGGGSWWEVVGAKAPVSPGFNYPLLMEGAGTTLTDFECDLDDPTNAK